jgi:hypothetical protein
LTGFPRTSLARLLSMGMNVETAIRTKIRSDARRRVV